MPTSNIECGVAVAGSNCGDLNGIDWLYELEHDWIDTEIRSIICNLISYRFCNHIISEMYVYSMSKLIAVE